MKQDERAFVLDFGTLLTALAAAGVVSSQPRTMLLVVLGLMALRTLLWTFWVREHPLGVELGLYVTCILFGGLNDWNTVFRHRVYEYTVPSDIPQWSSIPLWMLILWGPILRFVVSLGRFRRLGEADADPNLVRLPGFQKSSAWLCVALSLALVLITRQFTYRLSLHVVFSWLPYLVAIVAYVAMFRPAARKRNLAIFFILVGTLFEVLLAKGAGLHRYNLGWVFGIPIWIVLWWGLGAVIISDFAERALSKFVPETRPRWADPTPGAGAGARS